MQDPVADHCHFDLQCQYEEEVGLGTRKRWWELSVGTTIFYLTQTAHSMSQYEKGWSAFSTVHKQRVRWVPVTISDSTQTATDKSQIPRSVKLKLFYYQKDLDTKVLVDSTLEYAEWEDVPVNDATGQLMWDLFDSNKSSSVLLSSGPRSGESFDLSYRLQIEWKAIGYLDILNSLHFDIFPIYIVLYVMFGGGLVVFMFLVWFLKRICTKLRDPPHLVLVDLSLLYTQPLLTGFALSLVPAALAVLVLYGVYLVEYPFSDIPGSYGDNEELNPLRISLYRSGRMGYAMLLFGVYFVVQGSQLIISRPRKLEFDNYAWRYMTVHDARAMILHLFTVTLFSS